jgi:hypothetical protein
MGMIVKSLDVLQSLDTRLIVCVLFSTMCFLLRLITLSCPCLIIFKLFVEFVASNFVTCKSFDSNFVCASCIFLRALIKVSLCDVWG